MSDPTKNPFDPFFDRIREIVREEIQAALAGANNDQVKPLLYTTKQAAALLGVEESWLAARARTGEVPNRKLGRYRRFSIEDVNTVGVEGIARQDQKTYFIYSSLRRLIKIGRSKDPNSRMSNLRSSTSEKLTVVAVIDSNREKELHRRFKHLRVIGEWFDYSSEIRDFLKEIERALCKPS